MKNLTTINEIRENVDKDVLVEGMVSEIIWQHMMAPSKEFPYDNYFDLPDQNQIVVYSKQKLPKNMKLKLTGKVIEVRGRSKRPNEKPSKIDDTFAEYHLNVQQWEKMA